MPFAEAAKTRTRRSVLLVLIIPALIAASAGAAFFSPVLRHPILFCSLLWERPQTPLSIPVQGIGARELVDSWGSPRPGGRQHQGIDIFAPKDRPVLAATRGIVWEVGLDGLGGNIVKVLGPRFEWHYYAHLNRFGAYRAGDAVRPGDILGYVGDTGNAKGTPFHLHYGINSFLGEPRNPYSRLSDEGV